MTNRANTSGIPEERTRGHQLYQKFASWFGRIYSTDLNPLYHLGDVAILLFTIACVSGIYIFIFYNVNPHQAWNSVEAISNGYFNGWMRSIHRYSSDLLVIFIIFHLIQSLFTSKFKRIVSWISGIIAFFVVVLIGVTGYMLVWDQKAKLIGYLTTKLFAGLPIFDPAIAGGFLLNDLTVVGGFFKVALFGHIAFSLITVIVIWIHVVRISKPKIFPPKKLILYAFIALGIISALFPVESDPPAQESNLPINTTFDWYYFYGYYLMKLFSVTQNWAIIIGSGLFLCIIPYIIKRKNREPVNIDLEKCDACNLCSYDCPYEAIDMLGRDGQTRAILSPDKCVGCGICIGSCKEHAITHPQFPLLDLTAKDKKDITVFSCSYFPDAVLPDDLNIQHYKVPCLGSVMPKDVQSILENNSKAIALLGCEDCYYRMGKTWTIKRFMRKRAPAFSKKFDASRVLLLTLTQYSKAKLIAFSKVANESTGREGQMNLQDYGKTNPVLSVLILAAFFALMVPLSSTVVHFFNPTEKMLIVNFKYISSPTEFEKTISDEKHMQAINPIVKRRSPVLLKVYSSSDKSLIYHKEYAPRGLRQDIAMFIYSELVIKTDQVDIELIETVFPDKKLYINNVALKEGDGTFVVLKDNKLVLTE